jgi:prevent-host-death family protein
MSSIGVRELKAQLSQQLKRVQRGSRLTITDRGRPIAVLSPVEPQANAAWAWRMVAEGKANWSGGKPRGLNPPVPSRGKPTSQMVLEDRR